jgi:hypothetical protein
VAQTFMYSSSHPLVLSGRFILELLSLYALGRFGFQLSQGPARYAWAIGLPLFAALLWGTFAVPGDPSRSGKAPVPISGTLRLLLELTFFGSAGWALFASGAHSAGWLLIAGVLLLHLLSLDRLTWLLRR